MTWKKKIRNIRRDRRRAVDAMQLSKVRECSARGISEYIADAFRSIFSYAGPHPCVRPQGQLSLRLIDPTESPIPHV